MIVKMHRSANITIIYSNGYCLVVRLSCQMEAAVIPSKDNCLVRWSGFELSSECIRKLRVIETYFRT